MLLIRDLHQGKGHTQTESEGTEIDISWNNKKAEATILISDQIDFKTKIILKNIEGH